MAKLMEINTYHMRACRTKAEDVAGNGYRIYPKVEKPDEKQKEKLEEFIKKQPEPIEKTFNKLQLDKECTGYFAMEIARTFNNFDGEVDLIGHIPAHTIRIHKSGVKYCQSRNTKKVWFRDFNYEKDIDSQTGQEQKAKSLKPNNRGNEVVWSVNYTPRSCFYGIPDVTPSIGAITGDVARRDYNVAFFSNFGVPAYLVSISGDFDPGEIDPKTGKTPLVANIEKKFQELVNNPQSVMILTIPKTETGQGEITIKVEPLSTEVKEASFRLYRNDNRDEVIASHGMPPYRMGIYETGQLAGNLGREATTIYYESIIKPRQNVFNHIMNHYILPTLGITDYVFELESIDLTEIDNDVERCIKLIASGVMTPNDAIEYLGEYFGLKVDPDNIAMTFHYINGRAIDSGGLIPESEIIGTLNGLKDKLIEGFIDYVGKSNNGVADRDRRITKAIAQLEKEIQSLKGRTKTLSETPNSN
jgi:PBSX family phage portal protein